MEHTGRQGGMKWSRKKLEWSMVFEVQSGPRLASAALIGQAVGGKLCVTRILMKDRRRHAPLRIAGVVVVATKREA